MFVSGVNLIILNIVPETSLFNFSFLRKKFIIDTKMNKEVTQISQLMNNDYSCKICKRKFGTYQALAIHLGKTECINIELYIRKYYYNNEIPKCICGCGKEVNWNCTQHVYRSMLNGHNWRGKTKENNEIVRIKSEKTQKKLKGRRGHKQTKKTRAKIGIGVSTNWKKGLYDNKITIHLSL